MRSSDVHMEQTTNAGALALLCLIGIADLRAQTLSGAIALTDREQFENATSAFRKLVMTSPQDGAVWFYMGENYFYSERDDSAEYCFTRGIEVNPRYPLNRAGLGKLLSARGLKAEAQAQFEEAVATALEKSNKFPKSVQATTYREVAEGLAHGQHKDLAKAQEFIARAIEIDANEPEAYILKGDVLFEARPFDASEALANYKKAIELAPMAARPVAKKAFMYHRAQNYKAAIEEYTKAIGLDASFAPSYSGRAESYFMNRDYQKAAADYDTYLSLNSGSRSARVRYAKFLFMTKKYDEALREIESLKTSGTTDGTLKRVAGYAYAEKGDFEQAKASMDDYFMEQPKEKIISTDYEYMAKIYAGLAANAAPGALPAEYDSLACEMCVKGAEMDRSKDYLYIEAVKLFIKSRKYDRAIQAVRSKLAAGRPETNDYYYLGLAAVKGKRWQLADSAWAIYIERNPSAYQGHLNRARVQASMDSLEIKTWAAKPYYDEMLRRMKPEEREKAKSDLEEAYNYMGLYNLYNKEAQDLPRARCYFEKVRDLNAGTSLTRQVNETFLMMKELKDVKPGACELM